MVSVISGSRHCSVFTIHMYILAYIVTILVYILGPLQISTNNLGYAIRLEGNFVTVSGEDLSPDCSNRYSAAMLERSLQVMVLVNGRIGTQVCRSIITGGMKLETATASIAVTGDRVSPDYITVHHQTSAKVTSLSFTFHSTAKFIMGQALNIINCGS